MLSSPPETPMTSFFAPVCFTRFSRAEICIASTLSHLSASSSSFPGTNGSRENFRSRFVRSGISENPTAAAFAGTVPFLRRS